MIFKHRMAGHKTRAVAPRLLAGLLMERVIRIFGVCRTQCDALEKVYMIANDTRFTDHHARTMVDGEILSDLCARMNVDTRVGMSLLGDDTRNDRNVHLMEHMSKAVVNHGLNDRVGKDDLTVRGRCRIVVEDSLDVGVEQMLDEW